ncbi:MAG: indolepyruvate ferredoxin oxidoreductase [Rhodospirillaceae bacterium]|nr:indolepyruvate ferredoxin oxidoreductase [Rhodospirillaceae bacterium]|tara:strand:+ start:27937 stop:31371 length:3435 start_codon:yes stop_codon:yes gene_type:complete
MKKDHVSLDDKYLVEQGKVFISGTQALVRIPIEQARLDKKNGLNTSGYISGYRGSPLGGYDNALWKAENYLKKNNIIFKPGVNEDIAATACWGTQQVGLTTSSSLDGVFSIWYGKGPGVDRSGDPLKHANLAGTSRFGGVLALAGDDHMAKSSTSAHQSEQSLISAMIPIFNPSSVQELIDFGLFGIALSRYAGVWVGLKCVTEIVESSCTTLVSQNKKIIIPEDFVLPKNGVNIRWPDDFLDQEKRLLNYKLEAVKSFVSINNLNQITHASSNKKLGIVTTGKTWLDICSVFSELGLNQKKLDKIGISVFKVAMPWPLDTRDLTKWAKGFSKILVLEEKRNIIEDQLARALYHLDDDNRPKLIGKTFEEKNIFVPSYGELNSKIIKEIFNDIFSKSQKSEIPIFTNVLGNKKSLTKNEKESLDRNPWFCAGCPHNTSTKIPNGSKAFSGIGCHFMVNSMDRETATFTHMGGEGSSWIGISPFVEENHIFQNIGDGTYFHSGILSIRAAISSGVNITFKILFNEAVALTGGQAVDGKLTTIDLAWQLFSEGVSLIAIVSVTKDKYHPSIKLPENVKIFSRNELDEVQKKYRNEKGVTAIIYDQVCAAELRRKRKRNILPEPNKEIFINDKVCEGCGDCNAHSNCVAVQPYETKLGRKRIIDKNLCNKDMTCVDGYCPSFVLVEGVKKKSTFSMDTIRSKVLKLIPPLLPKLNKEYNILLAGIGGTGVVTTGSIISMAAHIDGNESSVLDQTGLSQKNGSVFGHIKIFRNTKDKINYRISDNSLDLLIGFDCVTSANEKSLQLINKNRTKVFLENEHTPLPILSEKPNKENSNKLYLSKIAEKVKKENIIYINAKAKVESLFHSTTSSNLYFIGYCYQLGYIPVSLEALEKAIRLNGVSIENNLTAFYTGILDSSLDIDKKSNYIEESKYENESFDSYIKARKEELEEYQSKKYANQYINFINKIQEIESRVVRDKKDLSSSVAKNLFKVMTYKDEYYVSKLLSKKVFLDEINSNYEKVRKITFLISPPFLSLISSKYRKKKIKLGRWFYWVLLILSKFKFIRNTIFDPFRWTKDRRDEVFLLKNYLDFIESLENKLNINNYNTAVQIASLPDLIRGYGYIKRKNIENTKILRDNLLLQFNRKIT